MSVSITAGERITSSLLQSLAPGPSNAITLAGTYTSAYNPSVRLINSGVALIQARVTNGATAVAAGTISTVGTVPAAFYPTSQQYFIAASGLASTVVTTTCYINTSGQIILLGAAIAASSNIIINFAYNLDF